MRRAPSKRQRAQRRPVGAGLQGPVRDAGVSVRSRRPSRVGRSPYPILSVVVAVLGLAFIGWMLTWGDAGSDATTPPDPAAVASVAADAEPEREPTPLFAQEGGSELHLAVDPGQLTAVGFHQASGDLALHLASLVPDADMAVAAELHAVPPVDAGDNPDETVWPGTCLRLWRSGRTGQPDTAVDMGADPGTPVWSPVSGTVVEVRPYLLYEKYEDYEIHIRPDGREDVDVVLIHVQDVTVKAGDRVFGGATQIAAVRKMSDKIDIQLAGYTANGGDHVHLQINRIPAPGELAPSSGS